MSTRSFPRSAQILAKNRQHIPGGVVSVNRATQPEIVFVRGEGARIWDAEGNSYLDYHAAFAPHFLGHNDPHVSEAVHKCLRDQLSLFGSGTTEFEGRLAELICQNIPWVEGIQFLNTGSEATYHAIRLARAITGRDDIMATQGAYHGWHNDVASNLMTPLEQLGPRISPGEYAFWPISAGIPETHKQLVHTVNFNDLNSVRWVCERVPIAALIVEPILQNIGLVKPLPGYLAGLRSLADEFGFLLIFDEVKTGFRHAIGGFSELSGVHPDLVVYGKAIANGYPIAALGGKSSFLEYTVHPDPRKRVLVAGTYNAHPVSIMAAIATIERLVTDSGAVYKHVEKLGKQLENGVISMLEDQGITGTLVRQGSAFCLYFMSHAPVDWHDLASSHLFSVDNAMRRGLIDKGIYFFPLASKQCSISAAHTTEDISHTLTEWRSVLESMTKEIATCDLFDRASRAV